MIHHLLYELLTIYNSYTICTFSWTIQHRPIQPTPSLTNLPNLSIFVTGTWNIASINHNRLNLIATDLLYSNETIIVIVIIIKNIQKYRNGDEHTQINLDKVWKCTRLSRTQGWWSALLCETGVFLCKYGIVLYIYCEYKGLPVNIYLRMRGLRCDWCGRSNTSTS